MFDNIITKYVNFKYITFMFVIILFLVFIFSCKDIAITFFASFVIACSLNPIVDKLSKKFPRYIATDIVTAGILVLILGALIPICILSFEQISIFMDKLPNYIDNFDEFIFRIPILKQFHFLANDADNLLEQISLSSVGLLSHAIDIGKYVAKCCMYLVISIIIIFNLVSDKITIKNYFLKIFPSNMRQRAEDISKIIADKMGGYLTATLATSTSVGLIMIIGLLILNIPYALLLAIITAILDIIPIIGPALALLICIMAVYTSGTVTLVSVIAVFVLAQFIENNFVRPYVFAKVMHIHSLVIFLFMFIAAEYIGLVGVIFAPALAALAAVLFEELYLKKIN